MVQEISIPSLALAFVPVAVVVLILWRWSLNAGTALWAVARMVLQLSAIGFALTFIFGSDSVALVLAVLSVMLGASAWIAMRPLTARSRAAFWRVLAAIALPSLATLALVNGLVLDVQPWYAPRYSVPLGGMIFASAMNSVSLCAERFAAERAGGAAVVTARDKALRAALIPLLNSLFAVGLVTLPGMMTGQILSGVDPLVAARYQVVVMCMLFGASGMAAVLYLVLAGRAGADHQPETDDET